jgi:hypothetical protein
LGYFEEIYSRTITIRNAPLHSTKVAVLIIAMSLLAGTQRDGALPKPPHGWRAPTIADLGSPADQKWREKDPARYLTVIGDFDGDGIPDIARLMVRDDHIAYAIFVWLAHQDGTYKQVQLDEFADVEGFPSMGIRAVAPGEYPTGCARGYDCAEDEPRYLNLKHTAISYFKTDASNRYYYWNDSTRTFSQVGMND